MSDLLKYKVFIKLDIPNCVFGWCSGANGTLMVTLTGSDSATVTKVSLVELSGAGEVIGSVEAQGGRDFLVQFSRIPSVDFVILVKGLISSSSSVPFQRQSSTSIRASAVTVAVVSKVHLSQNQPVFLSHTDAMFPFLFKNDSNSVLVPGTPIQVPFSVATSGAGGTFSIQATNDRSFTLDFPSSVSIETGGSSSGTGTITAPVNTVSGTVVTLTIQASDPAAAETNYAVLRFTALQPVMFHSEMSFSLIQHLHQCVYWFVFLFFFLLQVTDFTPPVCQFPRLQSNCSVNCSLSTWDLSVEVTDGNQGSGVDRVSLRQGSGDLNTSLDAANENITLVSYNASCCSPDVELVVVDKVGNVGSCFYTVQKTSNATTATTTTTTTTTTTATTANTTTNSTQTQLVQSFAVKTVHSSLLCFSIFVLGSVFYLN